MATKRGLLNIRGGTPLPQQSKQALSNKIGQKFKAWKTELQKEDALVKMTALPHESQAAIDNFIEREITRIKKREPDTAPGDERKWRNLQIARRYQNLKNQQDEEFAKRFWHWIAGRGDKADHDKTPWGREPHGMELEEVREIFKGFIDALVDTETYLQKLIWKGPQDLNEYYIYFKYVLHADDYMKTADPWFFLEIKQMIDSDALPVENPPRGRQKPKYLENVRLNRFEVREMQGREGRHFDPLNSQHYANLVDRQKRQTRLESRQRYANARRQAWDSSDSEDDSSDIDSISSSSYEEFLDSYEEVENMSFTESESEDSSSSSSSSIQQGVQGDPNQPYVQGEYVGGGVPSPMDISPPSSRSPSPVNLPPSPSSSAPASPAPSRPASPKPAPAAAPAPPPPPMPEAGAKIPAAPAAPKAQAANPVQAAVNNVQNAFGSLMDAIVGASASKLKAVPQEAIEEAKKAKEEKQKEEEAGTLQGMLGSAFQKIRPGMGYSESDASSSAWDPDDSWDDVGDAAPPADIQQQQEEQRKALELARGDVVNRARGVLADLQQANTGFDTQKFGQEVEKFIQLQTSDEMLLNPNYESLLDDQLDRLKKMGQRMHDEAVASAARQQREQKAEKQARKEAQRKQQDEKLRQMEQMGEHARKVREEKARQRAEKIAKKEAAQQAQREAGGTQVDRDVFTRRQELERAGVPHDEIDAQLDTEFAPVKAAQGYVGGLIDRYKRIYDSVKLDEIKDPETWRVAYEWHSSAMAALSGLELMKKRGQQPNDQDEEYLKQMFEQKELHAVRTAQNGPFSFGEPVTVKPIREGETGLAERRAIRERMFYTNLKAKETAERLESEKRHAERQQKYAEEVKAKEESDRAARERLANQPRQKKTPEQKAEARYAKAMQQWLEDRVGPMPRPEDFAPGKKEPPKTSQGRKFKRRAKAPPKAQPKGSNATVWG